jgi:hypothetical protein
MIRGVDNTPINMFYLKKLPIPPSDISQKFERRLPITSETFESAELLACQEHPIAIHLKT